MKEKIPYQEEVFILNGNIEVVVRGKFSEIEVEASILEEALPEEEIIDYQNIKDEW